MSQITNARLTRADVVRCLRYDPDTGLFERYLAGNRWRKAGSVQGSDQHISISVQGNQYTAHTLAWLIMTGKKRPDVYHLNGDKQDNRWGNLAVPRKPLGSI